VAPIDRIDRLHVKGSQTVRRRDQIGASVVEEENE